MADQGLWFKLWCSAVADPDLDNLGVADFGRWCKLGAHMKEQGTAGSLRLEGPARSLCAMLQVPNFEQALDAVSRFPHVDLRREKDDVTGETVATVTFRNWPKYQGDYSTARVRKFREVKRSKRRGEERREEKRKEEPPSSPPIGGGEPSTSSSNDLPTPEQVQDAWNRICAPALPRMVLLNAERKRRIRARCERLDALGKWETLFSRVAKAPLLCGENERQWKATLDWLVKNDTNWAKVMEGHYDRQAPR